MFWYGFRFAFRVQNDVADHGGAIWGTAGGASVGMANGAYHADDHVIVPEGFEGTQGCSAIRQCVNDSYLRWMSVIREFWIILQVLRAFGMFRRSLRRLGMFLDRSASSGVFWALCLC